jgi:hypothetical protein
MFIRQTTMQSQSPSYQTMAATVTSHSHSIASQLIAPPTEPHMAELQRAWLEHQINPLGEVQWRGVPDSPLHE